MPRIKERTERFTDVQTMLDFDAAYGSYRLFSDLSMVPYEVLRRVLRGGECTQEEKERVGRALQQWMPDAIERRLREGDLPQDVQALIGRMLYALRKKDERGNLLQYPAPVR